MMSKKINIGLNGSMLDEHPTGVGVYSFNLINSLSQLYWQEQWQKITVFTPTTSSLHNNMKIIKLSGLLKSSKYGKIAALCRFLWNTFLYPVQARKFDLLISPTTHGSFLLKNQVIIIHDLLSLRYNNISAHQRFYFKKLLPFLISKAKLIIAVSETTKKDIIELLGCPAEKIKVIYNGYDELHYNINNIKENRIKQEYGISNYLLAVGPTYPHKNFEILINAYADLDAATKNKHPLIIAGGKKKYIDTLKELVTQKDLVNNIHFLGYVPFSLMPSLYKEAYALIFASLYEGFGLPLLEAMACGCPVIVSNTSSMPEVCGDAALYIDPLNKNSIIHAIQKITEDTIFRNALIDKGLERTKKFSWTLTAQSLKQTIENHFH